MITWGEAARLGILASFLAFSGTALVGCGGEETKSGTVAKVDEVAEKARQTNIEDLYKANNQKKQQKAVTKN